MDSNLSLSNISDLRIRPILDQTTARNIATVPVHSKLDHCNSLFLNLPANQLDRLQLFPNSAARAVIKTSRFHHITPILKSIHELAQNLSTYTLQDSIYCL